MAMRKLTIAKEALRQIDALYDIAHEGRSFAFHANSANNYMNSIVAAGLPLPDRILRNWAFLRTQGWRVAPHLSS